jgi:polar amino acid transport system substrate-binding protein
MSKDAFLFSWTIEQCFNGGESMKQKTKINLFLSLLVTLIIITSCGSTNHNNGSLKMIIKNKTLVVGTESGYAPYEFLDKDGNLQGLDIEIAKLIGEEIGHEYKTTIKVKFVDMNFEGLLGALQAGTIDMIAAAYSVTDDRKKVVDFSNIYIEETPVIVVRKNADIITLEELAVSKVGAQLGTTMEEKAKEFVDESKVTTLLKNNDLIMQLKTGTLDAVILEASVASNYLKINSDLKLATFEFEQSNDGGYAFAIQKNQNELLAIINKVIDELVEQGKIGEMFEEASILAQG